MTQITIEKAAVQFGYGQPRLEPLGEGLIHRTYLALFSGPGSSSPIVLQCINQQTFPQPENIVRNYVLISEYLGKQENVTIPRLISTHRQKWYWVDEENNFWRATEYLDGTFSPARPSSITEAGMAASRFASFTSALSGMDMHELNIIIPGFHDLGMRFSQFTQAISHAIPDRLHRSGDIIREFQDRKYLVDFYTRMEKNPEFLLRVMHHDCKISNMLFDRKSGLPVCPVDLDTVMPGYFFSDLGDMIRSMAGSLDENSKDFSSLVVLPEYYRAITEGYLEGIGNRFTPTETEHIHHAGLLMLYMQGIRFLADYLNNDIYYKTSYPDQNYNRAVNQLILLKGLESHLKDEYGYDACACSI